MARVNPAILKARERSLLELSERLGYDFKDLSLLDRALTHASMGNEGKKSYERLEFLGDAFLNFAVADVLFRQDTDVAEGRLTETRARIVSRQPLASAARKLDLQTHLLSGFPDPYGIDTFAFAGWGGDFYLFVRSCGLGNSTDVFRVDGLGTMTAVVRDSGWNVVGAGVSTCAPAE